MMMSRAVISNGFIPGQQQPPQQQLTTSSKPSSSSTVAASTPPKVNETLDHHLIDAPPAGDDKNPQLLKIAEKPPETPPPLIAKKSKNEDPSSNDNSNNNNENVVRRNPPLPLKATTSQPLRSPKREESMKKSAGSSKLTVNQAAVTGSHFNSGQRGNTKKILTAKTSADHAHEQPSIASGTSGGGTFSFRKLWRFFFGKKSTNLRGTAQYRSMQANKSKNRTKESEDGGSNDQSQNDQQQPNIFRRFVRRVSFLYKRPKNNDGGNFRRTATLPRSQSLRFGKNASQIGRRSNGRISSSKHQRSKSDMDNISSSSSPSKFNFDATQRTPTPVRKNLQRSVAGGGSSPRRPKSPVKEPLPPPPPQLPRPLTPISLVQPAKLPIMVDSNQATIKESSLSSSSARHSPNDSPDQPDSTAQQQKMNGFEIVDNVATKNIDLQVNGGDNGHFDQKQLVASVPQQRRNFLTNSSNSNVEVPATCGIFNHGNTCFMNSIIQCLSNTNPLAEYLVLDHYRNDLNICPRNYQTLPNKGRQLSTSAEVLDGAELTTMLATLLKSLWNRKYEREISSRFKKVCSKYDRQYVGFDPHDAQEFLLWLLNKIHEEMTAANGSKNISSNKSSNNNHNSNYNGNHNGHHQRKSDSSKETDSISIIYDLFQGKVVSTINCPKCGHSPSTTDPFTCISLPVPTRAQYTIYVMATLRMVSDSGKYAFTIDAMANVRELRDKISRYLKVPEKRLLLLRTKNQNQILEEFDDDNRTIQDLFEDGETINALETPELPENLLHNIDPHNEQHQEMYQQLFPIVWLNRCLPPPSSSFSSSSSSSSSYQANNNLINQKQSFFGPIFTTVVSREIDKNTLKMKILDEMSPYLKEHQQKIPLKLTHNLRLRLRVLNCCNGDPSHQDYICLDDELPLFGRAVEPALAKTEDSRSYRGPCHLKLLVEWEPDDRYSLFVSDEQMDQITMKKMSYVDRLVERFRPSPNTLSDCLKMYFSDENLSSENAFRCNNCNTPQQCIRKTHIVSLPDILCLHLKRFRFNDSRRIKVNTMIEYPQNGLDLLEYVQKKTFSNIHTNGGTLENNNRSPSRDKLTYRKNGANLLEETTYNLYAVCCHRGDMQGGHYIAYCKNSTDNRWYMFDDIKVVPVSEEDIITSEAYILFYQKSYVTTAYYSDFMFNGNGLGNCKIDTNHWFLSNKSQFNHQASWTKKYQPKKANTLVTGNSKFYDQEGPANNNGFNFNHHHSNQQPLNGSSPNNSMMKKYQSNGYHNHSDDNDDFNGNNDNIRNQEPKFCQNIRIETFQKNNR